MKDKIDTQPPLTRYIESSAVVAAILEGDTVVMQPSGSTRDVTSALTLAEAGRAIIRARQTRRISAGEQRAALVVLGNIEHRCHVIDMDPSILERVRRPFPIEPVRTLDAIHLATIEALAQSPASVTVVTRDEHVRANAEALGYATA